VKEALFSIVGPYLDGKRFLDLYAGTGAVGIEALSRGADFAVFVESNAVSLKVLYENLRQTRLTNHAQVCAVTSEVYCARIPRQAPVFDLVFLDPPYDQEDFSDMLTQIAFSGIIGHRSTVILEHQSKKQPPLAIASLTHTRSYRYGDTSLSLYRPLSPEGEAP
jgi:16S rRNA (guanine(966)-N(2))-methyltransferase RsmD